MLRNPFPKCRELSTDDGREHEVWDQESGTISSLHVQVRSSTSTPQARL